MYIADVLVMQIQNHYSPMIESCTSKNESLELLDLGIDQDTADLIYVGEIKTASYLPGVKFSAVKERLIQYKNYDPSTIIPAWTTDALLSVLPLKIDDTYQLLIFPDLTTSMWVCMYDEIEKHSKVLEAKGDVIYREAILKMVKWWLKKEKRET